MINAKLWSENHEMSVAAAEEVLHSFKNSINWEKTENVIDVGCGEGDVTLKVLTPKLPKSCRKVIGIDINEGMINLAKNKYHNLDVHFEEQSVLDSESVQKYEEHFSHAFMFHVLHWVQQDQKLCLSNIYKMLKPGGELVSACLVDHPLYNVMELMANEQKWSTFTQKTRDYISYYKYVANPVQALENFLLEVGFQDIILKYNKNIKYIFCSVQTFDNLMASAYPPLWLVPDHLKKEMRASFLDKFRKIRGVRILQSIKGGEIVELTYSTMEIFAVKSM